MDARQIARHVEGIETNLRLMKEALENDPHKLSALYLLRLKHHVHELELRIPARELRAVGSPNLGQG